MARRSSDTRTGAVDRAWVLAALERYEGPLILYASRLLGDPDRARDAVQETFLKLCTQDKSEIESRLAEWLYTVCRNHILDVLRKERRMALMSDGVQESLASNDASCGEVLVRREDASRALALLETLPNNQREVIRLKFQQGFSYKEISRITGLSISHVGVLIHHGVKALRARLAIDGDAAPIPAPTPASA